MKKIFTLLAAIVMTVAAYAQADVLEFCYADGTIIPDGSTVTANHAEPLFPGAPISQLSSGVYVKNTSGASVNVSLTSDVKAIASGNYSVCLGTTCQAYDKVGVYAIDKISLAAGSTNDMQCHWQPAMVGGVQAYGQCDVVITLTSGSSSKSITIHFVYADPASVSSTSSDAHVLSTYSVSGRLASDSPKGLVIRKLSDGRVRKVLMK